MAHANHEHVRILYLDGRKTLLKDEVISVGSISSCPISQPAVLRRAIELGSSAFILAHNHPSGDPRASGSDLTLTRALKAAGETLEVSLLDHIIVSPRGWTSMRISNLI